MPEMLTTQEEKEEEERQPTARGSVWAIGQQRQGALG